MFSLGVVLLALGCSGGCGGKAAAPPPEASGADAASSAAKSTADACAGQTDHLEKRLRATLAASEGVPGWNGWELPRGLWTTVADTPAIDAPAADVQMWAQLSISAAGLVGLEGEPLPAVGERAAFCSAVTAGMKKASIAGMMPTLLVRAHEQASGQAVAATLTTLHSCGIDAPHLVFERATPPNVQLEPPPPKLASVIATVRESGARDDIYPTAIAHGAFGDLYASCPIDRRSVAQAKRTERPGVLASALLDGFRACKCATDPDVMAYHLQSVTLPDTFGVSLPISLSPKAAPVGVEPGDDWAAVVKRFAGPAAAGKGPAPIWFADVAAGAAGAWSPAVTP